jgi:hypothetical protein
VSDFLLSDAAATGGAAAAEPFITISQLAGIPFRIGETSSISCGGQDGVSNAFQSALWLPDYAFEYAQLGVSGLNFFNLSNSLYSLFSFTSTTSGGTTRYAVQQINPLYYGFLLFAQTVQNHAQLLPITFATDVHIKAWATIDSQGTIRVLLLNKDEVASGPISVTLANEGQATVTRMIASSLAAKTGISLGGQTFDGSSDGKPQGTSYGELIQPDNGNYVVAVPAVSAALLTFQK